MTVLLHPPVYFVNFQQEQFLCACADVVMIERCSHLANFVLKLPEEGERCTLNDLVDKFHPIQKDFRFGWTTISGKELERFNDAVDERSLFLWQTVGQGLSRCHTRHYLFGRTIWGVKGAHTRLGDQQLRLEILEFIDKERRRFEKLRAKFDGGATEPTGRKREPIPEDVRIFVWRRDDGRCMKCGSQENLEYDHIIPCSRGGSNTARNLQLLCEACNRQKSDSI